MIMTTVFKLNITKIVSSIALTALMSFEATGNECATIDFAVNEKGGKQYVSIISSHNNEPFVIGKRKVNSIINGQYEYYLEEGQHTLIIEQWPSKTLKKVSREYAISGRPINFDLYYQTINIDVKAGRHYHLELLSNSQQAPSVIVKSESIKSCAADKKKVLHAKAAKAIGYETKELPEPLEYRLRRLMTQLASHHQNIGAKYNDNFFHVKFNSYIGTSIDNEYQENGSALKVLSVLPNSLANKLQLMSGDLITLMGGEKVKADNRSPNQQLNEYFNTLYLGEIVELKVVRNGEEVELTNTYRPGIIPEMSYRLAQSTGLVGEQPAVQQHKALSIALQFELDQLVIELSHYYQNEHHAQGVISINRDEKFDNRIGFSANKIGKDKNVGLVLVNIDEGSFAESIGLEAQDIITNINNQDVTSNNLEHLVQSLASLKNGNNVSITIQRDGEIVRLKGQYQAKKLVSFNLLIDLQSIDVANANFERSVKADKWNIINKKNNAYKRQTYPTQQRSNITPNRVKGQRGG